MEMINNFGHTTVVGTTRYGKSYFVKKTLADKKNGVLYYNTKRETDDLERYFDITGDIDIDRLINLLASGKKINYIPSKNIEVRQVELTVLIDKLINDGRINQNNNIYVAVDEVQNFDKKGINALKNMASIGISTGLLGVYISQRLSNIDNNIMTQSTQNVFFYTRFEKDYYKRYGLDADKIQQDINGQKYKFVIVTPDNYKAFEKL